FLGLNYGVDFKGGTVFAIRMHQTANIDELRSKMDALGLGGVEIQGFGQPTDVLIKVGTQGGGDEGQQAVTNKVKAALGPDVEYLSIDVVGPKVSGELTQQGTLAVVSAIIGIVIYVWFRFEWQFAI